MTEQEYREKFNEDAAVGWEEIDRALAKIYGDQPYRHYGTAISYMLGGEDPLDGISIYDQTEPQFHRHLISYGMSELYYAPDQAGQQFSKWGFEFTFRVLPYAKDKEFNNAQNEPRWAFAVMQNLARYVFDSQKWFEGYHFIPCNGPIRLETDTLITGVAFVPDPQLGKIDTPHGEVTFLQMVGLTDIELEWLWKEPKTTRVKELMDKMRQDNPFLITDLTRKHSYV